jgi:2-polyprenyl-3-methyl-5-hydroxy-6-metoxy-1,4-benzoquinol methylase
MTLSSVSCPIHKEHNECPLFWEFTIGENIYRLFKCNTCDLVFYSPFPDINYESHTDSIWSLKDYVHLNSNIDGLINNLLDHMPAENCTSMLEVGCGFGFTLDFAKRILNMEVVGYEPSLYGEIGAKELDLNIKRSYLTKEEVREKKFDIIYLSEVLEHIQDPLSFLSLLKEGLTENGVLILTTPDYKKLQNDLSKPAELALLSPEAHVILFSEKSLTMVLKEAGFEYVSASSPGSSLIAVSSFRKKKPKIYADKNDLIIKYYQSLLNSVKPGSMTYIGILYRLLRNYVDHGDYKEANTLLNDYPFPIMPSLFEINKIENSEQLYQLTVSCGSILFYYIGIMRLNYYHDFELAATCFLSSFLLCKKRLELVPNASVSEFEILWLAKYHQVISLFHLESYGRAVTEVKQILNFKRTAGNMYLPLPDTHLLEKARELQGKLIERL